MTIDRPEYTVAECRDRIAELNERIRGREDEPQSFSREGISTDLVPLEELRKERKVWESRLKRAKSWRRSERDGGSSSASIQGPSVTLE